MFAHQSPKQIYTFFSVCLPLYSRLHIRLYGDTPDHQWQPSAEHSHAQAHSYLLQGTFHY